MGRRPGAGHPLPAELADSHSDQDLESSHTEIDVVLGDMQARQQMDSRHQSYRVIAEEFIRGGNRPGDVPTALTFYHIAPWNKEIGRAILDWRNTDEDILRLVAITDELQRSKNQAQTQSLKQEVFGLTVS